MSLTHCLLLGMLFNLYHFNLFVSKIWEKLWPHPAFQRYENHTRGSPSIRRDATQARINSSESVTKTSALPQPPVWEGGVGRELTCGNSKSKQGRIMGERTQLPEVSKELETNDEK